MGALYFGRAPHSAGHRTARRVGGRRRPASSMSRSQSSRSASATRSTSLVTRSRPCNEAAIPATTAASTRHAASHAVAAEIAAVEQDEDPRSSAARRHAEIDRPAVRTRRVSVPPSVARCALGHRPRSSATRILRPLSTGAEEMAGRSAKLRGHDAYFGITVLQARGSDLSGLPDPVKRRVACVR